MASTPSAVVRMIEQTFPWTAADERGETANNPPTLDLGHAPEVMALLNTCRQLPEELLPTADDRLAYDAAINAIQIAVNQWEKGDRNAALRVTRVIGKGHQRHPITIVRYILARCPDDPVAAAVSDLQFIEDPDVRAELGQDIEEAKRALANREWKSATVVAASVVEALLLWAIDQRSQADRGNAIQNAVKSGKLPRNPDASLDKWVLADLIPVAAELGLIEGDTEKQTDLTRDFRNYIHPGRVRRKGKRCDEATAHGARSAVLLVIRDLKRKFF